MDNYRDEKRFGLLAGMYTESQQIAVDPRCIGFILINKGAVQVKVNGVVLKPYPAGQPELSGESFSYVDAMGRRYTENFLISFEAGAGAQLQLVQVFDTNK